MDKLDKGLSLAHTLGYSCIAEALANIDRQKWVKMLKEYHPVVKLPKNQIKSKPVAFNHSYDIYNDGRLFSKIQGRFLKGKINMSNGKKYLVYELGRGNNIMAARLVFFHFGQHSATKIEQLQQIHCIDNNTMNVSINNLQEVPVGHNLKEHKGRPWDAKQINSRASIKVDDLDDVKQMLSNGVTQKKIAHRYNTSAMSVYRFLKRHQLLTQ